MQLNRASPSSSNSNSYYKQGLKASIVKHPPPTVFETVPNTASVSSHFSFLHCVEQKVKDEGEIDKLENNHNHSGMQTQHLPTQTTSSDVALLAKKTHGVLELCHTKLTALYNRFHILN